MVYLEGNANTEIQLVPYEFVSSNGNLGYELESMVFKFESPVNFAKVISYAYSSSISTVADVVFRFRDANGVILEEVVGTPGYVMSPRMEDNGLRQVTASASAEYQYVSLAVRWREVSEGDDVNVQWGIIGTLTGDIIVPEVVPDTLENLLNRIVVLFNTRS